MSLVFSVSCSSFQKLPICPIVSTGYCGFRVQRLWIWPGQRRREMHRAMRTAVMVFVFTLMSFPGNEMIRAQTRGEQGCSVETNTAVISSHLSSIFSPEDNIIKDIFKNERALLFARMLTAVYPDRKIPLSADAVLAFSARGKTLLLFFTRSCLVAGFSTSSSAYAGIKAKMRTLPVS